MKITKKSEEIVDIRKTTNYYLTIENAKGDTMDITYQVYISNNDYAGYDTDERFFDENNTDITDEQTLNDFLGDDYDDFIDELAELTK